MSSQTIGQREQLRRVRFVDDQGARIAPPPKRKPIDRRLLIWMLQIGIAAVAVPVTWAFFVLVLGWQ